MALVRWGASKEAHSGPPPCFDWQLDQNKWLSPQIAEVLCSVPGIKKNGCSAVIASAARLDNMRVELLVYRRKELRKLVFMYYVLNVGACIL